MSGDSDSKFWREVGLKQKILGVRIYMNLTMC